MSNRPTRTKGPIAKDTLYCSFCGKSQHDVLKLIAGPTVFICDECTELCDDIIWAETDGRMAIRIRTPITSSYDEVLYDAISRVIAETFPDYDIRYEFNTPDKGSIRNSNMNVAVYSILSAGDTGVNQTMKLQISDLSQKLSVMTAKFINESNRAQTINQELVSLKTEFLDHLREQQKRIKSSEHDLRVVMFMDISGFSKFAFENKQSVLDMLRGITPPLGVVDKG